MPSILTQFLIDIVRGSRRGEFESDPAKVIGASGLSPDLKQAVRDQDVGALWLAGAHPMALMYFARTLGWSNERYYSCLQEAELRRFCRVGSRPHADGNGLPNTHR